MVIANDHYQSIGILFVSNQEAFNMLRISGRLALIVFYSLSKALLWTGECMMCLHVVMAVFYSNRCIIISGTYLVINNNYTFTCSCFVL